ncbi:MAG: ribonuclease [Verrucomicrobiota bacterium]
MIATAPQLNELLSQLDQVGRVAIDTEADSLHCYREKLCLLQLSVADLDYVVDPFAFTDLSPLAAALTKKEVVLHGADFDLRLLRRSLQFAATHIFDTVIAARILGIREFSLAALVLRYFKVELAKGSQKANWAQRPLPKRMLDYAVNDTHYLLDLAKQLEDQLSGMGRLDWFRQSCGRAIEQAALERTRDADEIWRISGAGALRGRAAAILRELWHWREKEAEATDRPPFHVLQNQELLRAADSFSAGKVPDYRHFSTRRRAAFLAAANRALQMEESDLPAPRPRLGLRRSTEMNQRIEDLKRRRDRIAAELHLEPAFLAPRAALESIVMDAKQAETLLVPWQRELLGLGAPA